MPEAALLDGEGKTTFEPAAREASPDGGPFLLLVHAVWQSFQCTGEELRILVWALQERSITAT